MTYLKRKLIKAKKQKDYEDEIEAERQAELAEKRKNPWKKEIANCKDLIAYCKLLLPSEAKQEEVKEGGEPEDVEKSQSTED